MPGPLIETLRQRIAQLEAALTAPLQPRQAELFEEDCGLGPKRRRLLAALVDRLSNRLGPKAVLRARRLAEAQPELADWLFRQCGDGRWFLHGSFE